MSKYRGKPHPLEPSNAEVIAGALFIIAMAALIGGCCGALVSCVMG